MPAQQLLLGWPQVFVFVMYDSQGCIQRCGFGWLPIKNLTGGKIAEGVNGNVYLGLGWASWNTAQRKAGLGHVDSFIIVVGKKGADAKKVAGGGWNVVGREAESTDLTILVQHRPFHLADSFNVEVASNSFELQIPGIRLNPMREMLGIIGYARGCPRIPNDLGFVWAIGLING